jgi:periplasmic divalent cation tolerance protein
MPLEKANSGSPYCIVITTCSTDGQAEMLSSALLDRHLAACVQVLDITSRYVWQGKRQSEPEKLLLIKTRRALYPEVETLLRSIHPYQTPEIIALSVLNGLPAYFSWIDEITGYKTGNNGAV